jgi:hypothetical protein
VLEATSLAISLITATVMTVGTRPAALEEPGHDDDTEQR